jgi:hypothetical protein
MKFGITISAALAIMAGNYFAMPGQAVAGNTDQAVVVKVADQDVVVPAPRVRRSHRFLVRLPDSYPYPLACESVLFPRSPACAGRPAAYGFYANFPWNHYKSY